MCNAGKGRGRANLGKRGNESEAVKTEHTSYWPWEKRFLQICWQHHYPIVNPSINPVIALNVNLFCPVLCSIFKLLKDTQGGQLRSQCGRGNEDASHP